MPRTLFFFKRAPALLMAFVCMAAGRTFAADVRVVVDAKRVDAIAAMLPDGVFAFGPRIGDRDAWEKLARQPELRATIAMAQALASEPIPPLTDDLYLEFSRTGNRQDYEKAYFDRAARIAPLVVAECIERRGRFVPAIEKLVAAFDEQKIWMLPAHDGKLENFRGQARDIDLFSSALACNLANAGYVLGDTLSPRTREQIDRNVRRRVLDPFRDMVTGKRQPNVWITLKNNWNAVCLDNVLGAALATLPDKHDRAVFAAAAEQDSTHYLEGFASDGYCVEGLGYWNYGFGNYMRLCESLYQATGGQVDCFTRQKVRAIAEFPHKLMIADGVYPAYGDAHLDFKPSPPLVDFLARRFALPGATAVQSGALSTDVGGSLAETLMLSCPNSATGKGPVAPAEAAARDWFPDAQVLTCRPGSNHHATLAVSIKGGRNGVSHGHDDLGSFVLVVGNIPVLVDPGAEVYTARTFSEDRYKSTLINSFGHNVPFVAGKLQISTPSAQVKILKTDFGDPIDTLAMDLTSAYAAPELTQLHRTFTYDRTESGSLTVEDECHFSSPASFGVQFITFGHWKQTSPTQLLVWQDDRAVRIDFDAHGKGLIVRSQPIEEDLPGAQRPTHISVDLDAPTMDVTLKSVMRPDSPPARP
ncbi:MAG: heparinase II/III family protein [Tepidisphaeraceae bacterium]